MIFISHSSKDYENVIIWVKRIETTGLKCWISERDLSACKSSWETEIMKALNSSDVMLLYLSPDSAESGQVHNEIGCASSMGKPIIPLISKDFSIPPQIKYNIEKYEWIRLYSYSDTDAWDILRNRIIENDNKEREQFWGVTMQREFVAFTNKVMKKYYGDNFIALINGQEFPVYCVNAAPLPHADWIKDFDVICDIDNSRLSDFDIGDHQEYKNLKWYSEYNKILVSNIRYPNRPGYMLDEICTDSEGRLEKIRVHIGTYAENVFSSHVLEYELYRAFLEYRNKDIDNSEEWEKLRASMVIRNSIHGDIGISGEIGFEDKMRASLLKGDGRDSLLSVQMLVIFKSKRNNQFEVKCIQRSKSVAVKPGVFQFIPAGGFEILNDSNDDIYDNLELEENFSPGCAVFREYLEEMFNIPEFAGNGTGSVEDRLLKDPRIATIENMLKSGKAELRFLGSIMDLSGLRHELSFVLVVYDEDYSETQFIANEECKKGTIYSIRISDFEKKTSIWKNIHGPSAALWELFKRSDLYDKLMSNQYLN